MDYECDVKYILLSLSVRLMPGDLQVAIIVFIKASQFSFIRTNI